MKYFIFLLFFLLSLGQIGRISFLGQQINIYLHEVVMLLIIINQIPLQLNFSLRAKKSPVEGEVSGKVELLKWIFFFLIVLLLSLINNFWQFTFWRNFVGFLYWARLFLYFSFFVSLLNWFNKDKKNHTEIIKKGISFFILLTIIFSYLQYSLYPNLRNLYYLGWDPHQYRVFGLFFDTSIAGIIFVIVFFWIMAGKEKGFIRSIGLMGLIGLILLTYSRITYLSFIIGLIYFFKNKITFKKFFIFILLFFIFIFLLPRPSGEGVKLERIFTIKARVVDYQEGLKLWLKKPLLGYGYNRLRYIRKADDISHSGASFSSSFLTILVASGLIGFLGLMGFIAKIVKQGNHLARTIILVVMVASLFDNILLNNFVLLFFLVIISVSVNPLSDKLQRVL